MLRTVKKKTKNPGIYVVSAYCLPPRSLPPELLREILKGTRGEKRKALRVAFREFKGKFNANCQQ